MDTLNNNDQPGNRPFEQPQINPIPAEPQMAFSESAPSGEKGGNKKVLAVVVSVLAVVVLVAVGYFIWKTFSGGSEPLSSIAPMENPIVPPSTIPPQTPPPAASDEIADIEKDLNSLDMTGLDSQFQQDFSEIDKAL